MNPYVRLGALLLAVLIRTIPASATEYFVSTATGNDANNGTSKATAWKTISKAANTLIAGDVASVMNGIYQETVVPANSGTETKPILYRAIEDSVQVVPGVSNKAFLVDNRNFITIQGFNIRDASTGIAFFLSNGPIGALNLKNKAIGNKISNCAGAIGLEFATDNEVRQNLIKNCQFGIDATYTGTVAYNVIEAPSSGNGTGINIGEGSQGTVSDNTISGYGNGVAINSHFTGHLFLRNRIDGCMLGITGGEAVPRYLNNIICNTDTSIEDGETADTIVNNTIINARDGILQIVGSQTRPNCRNNIVANFAGTGEIGIIRADSPPWDVFYNDIFGFAQRVNANVTEFNAIFGDPSFADGCTNPTLLAGSPAINAGDPAAVFNDLDGTRNDAGAFGGPFAFNTIPGANRKVTLTNGVTVTFDNVLEPGHTSVTTAQTGAPTGNFLLPLSPTTYYQISTTAVFSGNVYIDIKYDDSGLTLAQEAALRLFHFEVPPGNFVDITDSGGPPGPKNPNTGANTIKGTAKSFSDFIIGFRTVVINEIMWDEAEYLELRNLSDTAINIAGWVVTAGGDTEIVIDNGATIPANGFYLIADAGAVTVTPNEIDAMTFVQGGEQVVLMDNNGRVVDIANDTGPWFAGVNDAVGQSMERDSNPRSGDVKANWHTSTGFVGGRIGTPGQANTADPVRSGNVVINEIMWDELEYIELRNLDSVAIDLSGWQILEDTAVRVTIENGRKISADSLFLIADSNAVNFPPDQVKTVTFLQAGKIVKLFDPAVGVIDTVNQNGPWFAGANDSVGQSMERVSPTDPGTKKSNWHTSTGFVGGRKGTPRSPNTPMFFADPGNMVVNEIMWDETEYIEILNLTDTPFQIENWIVISSAGDTKFTLDGGRRIGANGFFLVGDPNATTCGADETEAMTLLNGGELLKMIDQRGVEIDTANRVGAWFAGQNTAVGVSMERKTPPGDGAQSASWKTSTGTLCGRQGTPRAANSP